MFVRSSVPFLLLLTILLLVTVGTGCGREAKSSSEEEVSTALPVEVARVERGIATAHLSGTASIEAKSEATVVARVGGVVEDVFVEEGAYVTANQPLAQLDDERLRLEVRRAEVALRKLKTAFDRSHTMFEKQLVSQETFEQARSEYEGQLVAKELAELDLAYATIRAPIGGWVSQRHVKPGNMVRVNDQIFDVTSLNPLRAVLHVPERDLAKLRVGQSASLRFDALPDRTFSGRVSLISPVVDPSTGTFRVTVEVQNPSQEMKPGMFGRVDIQYDHREKALLVPKSAIVEEDNATTVFVVRDTIALQHPVTTGYSLSDKIEVLGGLNDGDQVVLSGQTALRDSARVEIIESESTE